jgi:soluble lytic murein transglycosylase-like protein
MQSLLLKLQADVEARKQPKSDLLVTLRSAALGCTLFFAAYQLGAHSAGGVAQEAEWAGKGIAAAFAPEGAHDLQSVEVERLRSAFQHSAKYHIPADLAANIEDVARAEGIDVGLAFDLVRAESEFNPRAVSPVGAVGYTQLMPETARLLRPGLTRDQLFQRETNLRLGFRFLKSLLVKYHGNRKLALLAYNRGPDRVDQLLRQGIDPSNGYVQLVTGASH